MVYAWSICGVSVAYVRSIRSLCMEYLWLMHGVCMEYLWVTYGVSMEYPSKIYGVCRAFLVRGASKSGWTNYLTLTEISISNAATSSPAVLTACTFTVLFTLSPLCML